MRPRQVSPVLNSVSPPTSYSLRTFVRWHTFVCLIEFFRRKLPARALIYSRVTRALWLRGPTGEFIAYESIFYPDIALDNTGR